MSPRRQRRDPNTRTVVRIPEQALHERVLDLAAPLLERLATYPSPEAVGDAVELAIAFWNAKVKASELWGIRRPKQLNDLQRKMTGKKAAPGDGEIFELLSQRWRDAGLLLDPRLVGEWSLEIVEGGEPRLSCEMQLPDGIEAHIPPPIEKRVAIGGEFLDEMLIRRTATSYLGFPVEAHRGQVASDGSITIHTQMPIAVALFAKGVLHAIGGGQVDITVAGREHTAMLLCDVICPGYGGHDDVAVLVFRPASPAAAQ